MILYSLAGKRHDLFQENIFDFHRCGAFGKADHHFRLYHRAFGGIGTGHRLPLGVGRFGADGDETGALAVIIGQIQVDPVTVLPAVINVFFHRAEGGAELDRHDFFSVQYYSLAEQYSGFVIRRGDPVNTIFRGCF